MRKNFTLSLLLCIALPALILAQSRQSPGIIDLSKVNKYPGGAYPVWDSVAKKYNWSSPEKNTINKSARLAQPEAIAATDSESNSAIFHLVKDINKITDGGGSNYQQQFNQQHYAVLNDVAYFFADDGIHGSELWRSDDTPEGTYMIKDIEPGKIPSGVTDIVAANGKIYFTATTAAGTQPWISDGTKEGTHILKDLTLYENGAYPKMYTATDNKVFFFVGDNQLWVTDGTEGGTKLISISPDNLNFNQPVAVGNKLFFTTYSYSYNSGLWCSDGTDAGTFMVKQFDDYYGAQQLTALKNKLYFSANSGWNRTLWVSDGSDAGTKAIDSNGIVAIATYSNAGNYIPLMPFAVYSNTLYFAAYDNYNSTGNELYKYNPKNGEGIKLVKDITPGGYGTNIDALEIAAGGNGVYFKVNNDDGSVSLWKTNGTAAATKPVTDFVSNPRGNVFNIYSVSGSIYFQAYSSENGFELWKSDGTTAGTVIVKDIFPGIGNSYCNDVTALQNGVLFSATDGQSGYELWKSDGTSDGTQLLKDINRKNTESSIVDFNLTATANGVFFSASDLVHGSEPYYSDGTSAGTKRIKDIYTGISNSDVRSVKIKNDDVYFIANDNITPSLFKYNITTKKLVKVLASVSFSVIQNTYAVADNGLVFINIHDNWNGQEEIWRTDGTPAGTYMLKASYNSTEIVTAGNTAFFTNDENYHGNELYKSDGTVSGTVMVKDIYADYASSNPYSLFVYNDEVYFGAMDEYGFGFWKTNGTLKGTKKLGVMQPASVQPDDKNMSRVYCISNGWLYVNATFGTEGEELWKTNGTATHTLLVRDINPYYGSSINYMTDINDTLYFFADDGMHGFELWKSNGTQTGTKIIKDITEGNSGSNITGACGVSGKLYFIKDWSLWESSGNAENTMQVINDGLTGLSNISQFAATGNKLFFTGNTSRYGQELYEGDISSQPVAENKQENIVAEKLNNSFRVIISPNPVRSVANLQLSNIKNADIILADNSGRILWSQNKVSKTQLQIPMQQFATGIYFIKITSGSETTTLKLVKEN